MGKKTKEHRKRVARRNLLLNNPIGRKALALASRGKVIDELNKASTEDQIEALSGTVAGRNPSKLAKAIMDKAPEEMDKGIKKLQREGREVTAESLTAEIRNTKGFLAMCEKVGVTLEWFEELAKKRMEVHGL